MVRLLSLSSHCRDISDTNKLDNMVGEIITYCKYIRRQSSAIISDYRSADKEQKGHG